MGMLRSTLVKQGPMSKAEEYRTNAAKCRQQSEAVTGSEEKAAGVKGRTSGWDWHKLTYDRMLGGYGTDITENQARFVRRRVTQQECAAPRPDPVPAGRSGGEVAPQRLQVSGLCERLNVELISAALNWLAYRSNPLPRSGKCDAISRGMAHPAVPIRSLSMMLEAPPKTYGSRAAGRRQVQLPSAYHSRADSSPRFIRG